MATSRKGSFSDLYPLLIQTGAGILLLLVIWLIVSLLPMLEDIELPLAFSLTELLAAVISVAISAMLVDFGNRVELRMKHIMPEFPKSGKIINLMILFVVILIIYTAFSSLILPYLNNLDWIYHLVFLLGAIVLLGLLAYIIYMNMDQVARFFINSGRGDVPPAGVLCEKCGEKNKEEAVFCSFCGAELPQPLRCSSCGKVLKAEAKFCPSCGSSKGQSSSGKPDTETISSSISVCESCGNQLKEGAKFCPSCGNPAS